MFCIEDIAHALSFIPRFGGHLPIWYSVTDHCIMCQSIASKEDRFAALMHDCTEAYLMDLCTPIKKKLEEYYIIEHSLMMLLSDIFKFKYPFNENILEIDKRVLELEWNNIMIGNARDVYSQQASKRQFLRLYNELKLK